MIFLNTLFSNYTIISNLSNSCKNVKILEMTKVYKATAFKTSMMKYFLMTNFRYKLILQVSIIWNLKIKI